MAESVKKPATKKPAKKTTKKPATKKPVTSSKAKTSTSSTLTKKPATKKPTKKTTKKPAPKKPKTVLSSAKDSSHFTKELIPESLPMMKKNKTKVDTSMFTTVLAIFIVALVVLGGYIYSRQQRMMEPPAPPVVPEASNPQNIRISSSISLTPEIVTALENIVTQIAI
ncbi:hypothetical protein H6768_01830 [Candidatus Peribacteria bacterium]|nr:hypothetical protein [Candidatus Peribacteria bacterium]